MSTYYAIYTRCSTGAQESKGYSHEYQQSGIRDAMQKKGWIEAGAFADTASGTSFTNRAAGLDAAFNFCKKNRQVKYLLIFRLDRLGRDVHECAGAIKRFQKIGVEINCPDDWIDFSGTDWPLLISLKFGLAQTESLKISDRTRNGINAAKAMGLYPARPPVGFIKIPVKIMGKERAMLSPDGVKSEIIKALFSDLAKGMAIADAQKKYMQGLGMQKTQFQRLPYMPVYAGFVYAGGALIKGLHDPIVSQELFNEVQSALKARKEKPLAYSTNDTSFYLKGLLLDENGCTMTAYTSTGRHGGKFRYYGPKGKGQTIRDEAAHAAVQNALSLFQLTETAKKEIEAHIRATMQAQQQQAKRAIQEAQQQQAKAEERRKRIKMLLADGGLSGKDYTEIKTDIDSQEAQALQEIAKAQALNADIEQIILRACGFLTNICTIFAGANVEQKRKILQAVFPSGFSIEKATKKVRTPEINQIIGLICSFSSDNELLEIQNGANLSESPVKGGEAGKLRTHASLLMNALAA